MSFVPTGNILTRLGGLKNVSGRRVMPGENDVDSLEPPDIDVRGVSNEMDYVPTPEAAMIDPADVQGFDVRANQSVPPQEEPGFWSNLGSGISNLLLNKKQDQMPVETATPEAPPVETAQVDVQEGLPPVTASEQEYNPSQKTEETPGTDENEITPYAEVGAADSVMQNPNLKSEIERIFNTDISPEMVKQMSDWETALKAYKDEISGLKTDLNERQKSIKDRIASRDLSGQEQLMMALALIAPTLLAGATLGKEAAFGVLGGGAGALANTLQGQEKLKRADEEQLNQINRDLSKLSREEVAQSQKSQELKQKAIDATSNNKLKEIFQRDGEIVDGKLVLKTGNPLIKLDSNRIRDEKDLAQFKKSVLPAFEKKLGKLNDAIQISDKMYAILDQAEKQEKEGLGGLARKVPLVGDVYDVLAKGIKTNIPAFRDVGVDEEGNKVNLSELYSSQREGLLDMYRQIMRASGGTGGAGKHVEEHLFREIPSPFEKGALSEGKANIPQAKVQLRDFIKRVENSILNEFESAGVDVRNLQQAVKKSNINMQQSETQRKKARAQQAADIASGKK